MVAASLLSTLLLALTVAAKPVSPNLSLVKLPFAQRVSTGITGITNLVKRDQLRVKSLTAKAQGLEDPAAINSPATNRAIFYIASVGVGSPATYYDLIVDTGLSNTWVGATKPYVKTCTSQQTPDSVFVSYGLGNFSGIEYIDQVTIAPGLVIPKQSIGVGTTSTDFNGVDGILGVGPTALTNGTLSPNSGSTIPTVTDNLFSSGTISENLLSVSFEPITDPSGTQLNGELTWGGIDSTKFTGAITYTPVTTTFPASTFWGMDASISYAGVPILSAAGIVDTGTPLIMIASDAFDSYQKATGGVLDQTTGLLSVTSTQYANLKDFSVTVSGVTFALTPNAQILPRNLNTIINGTAGNIYLIVSDIGRESGSGLDFLLGQTFLERFYSVYDTANARIGLATTRFTNATTN